MEETYDVTLVDGLIDQARTTSYLIVGAAKVGIKSEWNHFAFTLMREMTTKRVAFV